MSSSKSMAIPTENKQALSLISKGCALKAQGRAHEAIEFFSQALAINPYLAVAYYNRAIAFHALGKKREVVADFERAIQLAPDNVEILLNIASHLAYESLFVQAIKILQRVLEISPDLEEAWLMLGNAYYTMGSVDAAAKIFARASERFPNNTNIRMAAATCMPQIPMSQQEIDQSRTRLLNELEAMLKSGFKTATPLKDFHTSIFYMAYHSRSYKDIAVPLAKFFLKAYPALEYVAPHCKLPRKKSGEKLKLGFIAPNTHDITINQFFLGVMEKLAKSSLYEVIVFSCSPVSHPVVQDLKSRVGEYVELPQNLETAHSLIANKKLDLVVHLETCSQPLMYFLPFARLAPLQLMWGGLPITSGIPNMDYFISVKDCEAPNGEEHYSEKLILLERTLATFKRPPLPEKFKTREELGLPTGDVRIYTCPTQLFKIHPDMDEVFAGILARDPKAVVLLFDPQKNIWQSNLRKRFALSMPPEYQERIIFIPMAAREDFLHILNAVDAVIDSMHLVFGTTAYLCLAMNVPFVTHAGAYFAGRTGKYIFDKIDASELVADTQEAYIELALKLGKDKEFYTKMQKKIAQHGQIFFDDLDIVDEFSQVLQQLYFAPAA